MVEQGPLVSVILPIRNEARSIRRVLDAVLAQDWPRERLEVLIVDGGSTDGTAEIVRAMIADEPRAHRLENPHGDQSHALNLALRRARGDVIVRVDGHTLIARDYVRRCVEALQRTGAAHVGGVQATLGLTRFGQAVAAAMRSPFGVPSRFRLGGAGAVDTVYLGAWRRDIFARVGGFDVTLAANEDYEHNYRIRRAGERVWLAPEIRAVYLVRETPRALAAQFFRYGRGKWQVLRKWPRSARPRHVVAPGFVAWAALGGALSAHSRAICRLWAGTLAAYALANALGSLSAARRAGWRTLPRLPLAFVLMHGAWGAGFWAQALADGVRAVRRRST